jgi:hypothetical protein
VIAQEQNVQQYPDFNNGSNVEFAGGDVITSSHPTQRATILYGSSDDINLQCSVGSPVYRCFPCGSARGFVIVYVTPGSFEKAEIMIDCRNSTPLVVPMTPKMLATLGVRAGEQFLGEIDGRRFYWNKSRPTIVMSRSLENKPVGEWKLKDLANAEGVVRGLGRPGTVAVVGDFRPHSLIRDGLYDYAIIDIEGYPLSGKSKGPD